MRTIAMLMVALAIVSCTGKWQQGDEINNGHDFLCNAGICDDSLTLNGNDFRYVTTARSCLTASLTWPHARPSDWTR